MQDIKLNNTEYLFLVGKQSESAKSYKVRSNKLMPKVAKGSKAKATSTSVKGNMIINDKKCKPKPAKKMKTLNYITVKRSPNCSLKHIMNQKTLIIPSGKRVVASCQNNDIRELMIIDSN
jgi:hypothetical protein